MMLNFRISSMSVAAVTMGFALATTSAHATGSVITDLSGGFTIGLGPNGELFDAGSYIGFRRNADSFDPLAPGTPRDSWGVSAGASTAYADSHYYGTQGILSTSQSILANSASFESVTNLGLVVTQDYSFVAPNTLAITETVWNNTLSSIDDIKFQRNVDWDVASTQFYENGVAPPIAGISGVIASSLWGFNSPSPVNPANDANNGANQTYDSGAGITLGLGTLASNATATFTYFYSIADGTNSAFITYFNNVLNGQVYGIITQSSENGAYPNQGQNYAILGVSAVSSGFGSGVNVPGPVAGAGLPALIALFGFGVWGRRRKAA
jgi:hypothetical protein